MLKLSDEALGAIMLALQRSLMDAICDEPSNLKNRSR